MDFRGSGQGVRANDPWDACSARDDCTGFNADGVLMFAAATADNTLPAKGGCLYVKKGCPEVPGYKWQANRDSTSALARTPVSADADTKADAKAAGPVAKDLPLALAEECDRRPECEGFSSAGALKSDTAAQRVVAANGVCLYTKLPVFISRLQAAGQSKQQAASSFNSSGVVERTAASGTQCTQGDIMCTNWQLQVTSSSGNKCLRSRNGQYSFCMQTDGNIVLYSPSRALWASGTWGRAGSLPYRLIMQADGNLVGYNAANQPFWASNTYRASGNYHLIMQDDGNGVIYDTVNKPIWATNTWQGNTNTGGGSTGGNTGTASGSCSDSTNILSLHNTYRSWHRAPAMTWDSTLERAATAWAQNLANQGCGLQHGGHNGAGQNLYMLSNSGGVDRSCSAAATAWYNEVSLYRFSSTPYSSNSWQFGAIGHFTQLVWVSSTRLGCGIGIGNGGRCKVVACHYSPTGNYVGDAQFLANVRPRA